MSLNDGFYNLVTDGTYFYSSNSLRNVVIRITQEGSILYDFIKIENPLCLAITNYTTGNQKLFIQTLNYIYIYEFDTPTSVIEIKRLPFSSSIFFPSMFHHTQEDTLYISNYIQGTITTIKNDITNVVYTNVKGISGMSLASNIIYITNYDTNAMYFFNQGSLQIYMNIPKPIGLHYSSGNFYVSYGTETTRSISVNTYGTPFFRNVFTDFLFNSNPLNILFFSNSLYFTLENSTIIYKNNNVFISGNFREMTFYNASNVTQSVIAMNPDCVSNIAFNKLIQLRTIGSNPNNPIPPVTTIVGRTQGNQIPFNLGLGSDYESLKMRRKAETLQYRNSANNVGYTLTRKDTYANMMKYGGAYKFSKARITQLLKENNGVLPCDIGVNNGQPIGITPPFNSGINDSSTEGYYLNPYIPYYPSL